MQNCVMNAALGVLLNARKTAKELSTHYQILELRPHRIISTFFFRMLIFLKIKSERDELASH